MEPLDYRNDSKVKEDRSLNSVTFKVHPITFAATAVCELPCPMYLLCSHTGQGTCKVLLWSTFAAQLCIIASKRVHSLFRSFFIDFFFYHFEEDFFK